MALNDNNNNKKLEKYEIKDKNKNEFLNVSPELLEKISTYLPPNYIFKNFTYTKFYQYLENSFSFWNNCLFTKNTKIPECKKVLLTRYLLLQQIKNGNEKVLAFSTNQSDMTHMEIHNRLIFTSSDDQSIKAFNFSGFPVRQFLGHTGGVWAFHMKNNLLVTGSTDKTARVWSISDQVLLKTLKCHKSTVRVLKCIDKYIITGGRDHKIVVWVEEDGGSVIEVKRKKLDSGQEKRINSLGSYTLLHMLEGHLQSVRCMDVSEKYLVTGSYDSTVKLWDYKKGTLLGTLATHKNRVYAVKIHKNWVASSGMDSEVQVTSLFGGETVRHSLHSGIIVWLDFYGPYIISSGSDGLVIKYNYIERRLVYEIQELSTIKSQCIGNGVLVVGTMNRVNLYNFASGKFIKTLMSAYIIVKVEIFENKIIVGYSNEGAYKISVFTYKL